MAYVIGLTGNIGVGKSTVLAYLASLGARTVDADRLAHEVMRPGGPAYDAVVSAFGPGILAPDGRIDRAKVAAIVFADPQALARLEAILHPAVIARVEEIVAKAVEPVIVVEAIKLLESGLAARLCDEVWVVVARPEVALARLAAQRGMSEAEARRRLANQMPEREKVAQATVVIDNSGPPEETQKQVEAAWQRIVKKIVERCEGRATAALPSRRVKRT